MDIRILIVSVRVVLLALLIVVDWVLVLIYLWRIWWIVVSDVIALLIGVSVVALVVVRKGLGV